MDWILNSLLCNLIVIGLITIALNALFIGFAKLYYTRQLRKDKSNQLLQLVETMADEKKELLQRVESFRADNELLLSQLRAQTDLNEKLMNLDPKENYAAA